MAVDDHDQRASRLARTASAGNVQAFGELYDMYVDTIYARASFKVRSREDAEDLTEHVFVKALRGISTFDPRRGAFIAWLNTITDRLVIDYYRTHKETGVLDTDIPLVAPDDPAADVGRRLDAEEVHAAIRELPHEHQQVLMLRFIADKNVAEVAQEMGKQEGAIRTMQYRALQSLRKLMTRRTELAR